MASKAVEKKGKKFPQMTVPFKREKDADVFREFEEAREYFPQGRKDAIVRAMRLYIEDVGRQRSGLVTMFSPSTVDAEEEVTGDER